MSKKNPKMADVDVNEELLDYEDEPETEVADGDNAGDAAATKSEKVKGNYVSIHSSGFRDFLLKPEVLRAIGDCGFEHPSEVQHECIAIHRGMTQEERLSRYQQFKDFQKRILVATNLFGRGMDIERVNIVFNYDMPEDTDTYLHRVARAGRFGTKGLAITFVSDESDAKTLNEVQERFEVDITELPEEIDLSSYIEGR